MWDWASGPLGWWRERPPHLRTAISLLFVIAGVGLFFLGFWRWAIGLGVLGLVLFFLSFPTRAEQKGYHDF